MGDGAWTDWKKERKREKEKRETEREKESKREKWIEQERKKNSCLVILTSESTSLVKNEIYKQIKKHVKKFYKVYSMIQFKILWNFYGKGWCCKNIGITIMKTQFQ